VASGDNRALSDTLLLLTHSTQLDATHYLGRAVKHAIVLPTNKKLRAHNIFCFWKESFQPFNHKGNKAATFNCSAPPCLHIGNIFIVLLLENQQSALDVGAIFLESFSTFQQDRNFQLVPPCLHIGNISIVLLLENQQRALDVGAKNSNRGVQ
jgi:hypothetical protein